MADILDFNTARRQGDDRPVRPDADDVKARVTRDLESYLTWLYGNAPVMGRADARLGDVMGEVGESLSISLRGPDRGLWIDHATGEVGDPLTLYMARMGYGAADFDHALGEIAKEFLGDRVEIETDAGARIAIKNAARKEHNERKHKERAQARIGGQETVYPYFWADGKIAFNHIRTDFSDGAKTFRFAPSGHTGLRPFYRMPELVEEGVIAFVEGEKCADALWNAGFPATTMAGGSNAPVDKVDWSFFAGRDVVVWRDRDEAGRGWEECIVPELRRVGARVGLVPVDEWFGDRDPGWDAADTLALPAVDPEVVKADLLEVARRAHDERPSDRWEDGGYRVLDDDELAKLPPVEFIVDGYLTRNGLSVMFGDTGAGKSFLAIDLGMCIAHGQDWHGHKVEQATVLYVAAEGSAGIRQRKAAWLEHRRVLDGKSAGFGVIPVATELVRKGEVEAILKGIRRMARKPDIIVIDTVARTFTGDENSQEHMTKYVQALDRLRVETGAHVMAVHHSGLQNKERARGSSVLKAALDTELRVERANRSEELRLTCTKQKDAEEPKPMKLTFRSIKCRDPLTSAQFSSVIIMDWQEDTIIGGQNSSKKPKLTLRQNLVVNYLKRRRGEWVPTSELALHVSEEEGKGVDSDNFRKRVLKELVGRGIIEEQTADRGGESLWKIIPVDGEDTSDGDD